MPENFATFLSGHLWILIIIAVWTIPWKGVALWRAARNQSLVWFIVLLIINTLGILEIFYIFIFSKNTSASLSAEASMIKIPEKKSLDINIETKSNLDESIPKS